MHTLLQAAVLGQGMACRPPAPSVCVCLRNLLPGWYWSDLQKYDRLGCCAEILSG
ncbi:uncharacterized protein BO96DRAFT_410697 [Aspergillus niger CBS 101883]|uniref:uncharacterized protein n=1 Tax=Aspergillus lacticoffeatus (strain CBS 101883) TaxID=1450533 RepID=UPI000D7FC4E1|nr:uncharacterized protein BO96DRAFT_410697 [Aspergillus niger CBS 101883]PYH58675.1 hypothetical protein BO96DRAFT_410697 [Aspergillus niger CBS 101883]